MASDLKIRPVQRSKPGEPDFSLAESLFAASPDTPVEKVLEDAGLSIADINKASWRFYARRSQLPPAWEWAIWVILAGRGWGKTRTGAEWAAQKRHEVRPKNFRCALVAATFSDARDTMVEGESGLLSVLKPSELKGGSVRTAWNRSMGQLTLADGSLYLVHTAESPNKLRGPQWHAAWCDELAAWQDASEGGLAENSTWSNLTAGVRLKSGWRGRQLPQIVVTTTPRPNKLVRYLWAEDNTLAEIVARTRGSSMMNLRNLADIFVKTVIEPRMNTRVGRQELEAEILEDYGEVFDTAKLVVVKETPAYTKPYRARCWDLAATRPNDSNPDPDWTVGTLLAMDTRKRQYCIEHMLRMRERPGARNDAILEQAKIDGAIYGKRLHYWIEVEPGSAGIAQFDELSRMLDGIVVCKKYRPTGSKLVRSEPVSAAVDQERVAMVMASWNHAMRDEMRDFTGDDTGHDDIVDTLSTFWANIPTRPATGGVRPHVETKSSGYN